MAAAENGSVPIVKALLGVGADVNTARYDGLTALMAGCGQTSVELVQTLLDKGAQPNAVDMRGVSACHMAAEVGALDIVTALVQAGADCTVMAHAAAITPLIVAAAAGMEEMVSLLLAITTDVDALHDDKSAMSALMAAASNGSSLIVDHILKAGANVNLRNSDGVTALMHSAVLSHLDVVVQLLERRTLGADEAVAEHIVSITTDPDHLLIAHCDLEPARGLAQRTGPERGAFTTLRCRRRGRRIMIAVGIHDVVFSTHGWHHRTRAPHLSTPC
jgi:ankyrin repeat protein